MNITYTRLTVFLVAIFAGLAFGVSYVTTLEFENSIEKRSKMDALSIVNEELDGHEFFNVQLKGKPLVVNIWAGWCKPCLKEIPELNKIYEEFKEAEINFIALSSEDEISDQEALEKANLEFDFPKLFLQPRAIKSWSQFALENEKPVGLPLNIILGSDGTIRYFKSGFSPENIEEMRMVLSELAENG